MTRDELITSNIKLAYKLAGNLYRKHGGKVDYEDIQGLCMLGLVKAADSFQENKKYAFSTYAYTVMKNEVQKNIYSNYKQHDISLNKAIGDEIELLDIVDDNEDYIEKSEQKINKHFLQEKISQLDDIQQKVINLYLQGCTRKEIAEKVGLTTSQANSVYNTALNKLRRLYDE